ncbi:zeste isoform 2-T2 [Glossina fuscipes fuscipes]
MSTDGSTAGQVTTSIVDDGSSSQGATGAAGGAGTSAGGKCQMPLTPRFTQEEKDILYSLFHQHEDVIDIKYRKKNRSKYSVRDAWEQIVRDFNSHPNVSAMRNLKQIQKFWLNARLRKQYPFRSVTLKQEQISADSGQNGQQNARQQQQQQQQQQLVNHTIKTEPEFTLNGGEANDNNDQSESYEEMEMDGNGVTELEENPLETQQHQQPQHQQLQQVVPTTAIHTQHINVDQISADKLTLTDLLHFKTARPREDIILQIKHPGEATAQITLPSPTRITIPTHQQQHTMATITANGYNQQIISEIKPQQITLAQYQAQQQLQQQQQQQQVAQQQQLAQQAQLAIIQQQQQQQQAAAVVAAAAVQQQQHQQVKMQLQTTPAEGATQFATATPTFTCTTFSALPTAATVSTGNTNHVSVAAATAPTVATITTAPSLSSHNNVVAVNNVNAVANSTNTSNPTQDPYEEKINYFKMKEAELRYKEQQVALEKKKIELSHTQDQLKHLREVHRLQVEELKVKIRILQEEEKQLLKAQSPLSS